LDRRSFGNRPLGDSSTLDIPHLTSPVSFISNSGRQLLDILLCIMDFSLPWQFVTPTEEEQLLRRELLNLRGFYAQGSIIAVIIVLRVYQGWARSVTTTEANSKHRREPTSWWDRSITAGWLETRRQYALCGLWLLWLFSLSVWNSGEGMSPTSL
jgi:hypothetical protein